jgi:hypothetical protein
MDSVKNISAKTGEWPAAILLLRKKLVLSVSVFLIVIGSLSLVAYFLLERYVEISGADIVFLERNFENTPFSLMDAHDACRYEAKSKLGDTLLRSEMLPLSTRFNARKGTYLVVLDADVGAIDGWSGMTIYCDIDPSKQQISYYKEVHTDQQSLFSSTMSLLGNLVN